MRNPQLLSIVGARPQFVKAAVVSRALAQAGLHEEIVHTGQHYDEAMSGAFLTQFRMTNIVTNLDVGSGSHSHQTARIMTGLQEFIDSLDQPPKAIVVYGDTNSTIAASLVASKIHIPLVHVEAGLRSNNRAMPEEVNRVVTDHLSDLLFCTSKVSVDSLRQEGISRGVHNVGDVMLDAFQIFSEEVRNRPLPESIATVVNEGNFALATIHRPSNTDEPAKLKSIVSALGRLSMPVLWPVHPRNKGNLARLDLPPTLQCIDPISYFDMLAVLQACSLVITDSGGLQKEAHWAQRQCITLRDETEWVETLDGGWNVLANTHRHDLAKLATQKPSSKWQMLYGDGKAAHHIAREITTFLQERS